MCEHTFVRWESQSVEAAHDARLPGFSEDVVVRRFNAPEALDTRFHEVRTKSAINRVPQISRVPFEYTVNPYRGWFVAGDVDAALLQQNGDVGSVWGLSGGYFLPVPSFIHDSGDDSEENAPTDVVAAGLSTKFTAGSLPFFALPTFGTSK